MWHLMIVLACLLSSRVSAQTNTIIFVDSTTSTTTTTTTTAPSMSGGMQCACLPTANCTAMKIDVRIVNPESKCAAGQVYCCTPTQGSLITNTCGIRKIPVAPHPQGQASYGAYPWQAALLRNNNEYIGSGALIDSMHVLTVAHKVAPYPINSIKVRLGEWDGQATSEPNPYQEYTISRVFQHRNFNSQNLQNDIAVLRLNSSVPISTAPNINTICLPTAIPAAKTRCWVTGWGKDAFGNNGKYQSIMKEIDVPILTQTECENSLRGTKLGQFFVLDKNSFLCAGGEPGKDACTGDGGSPLVCQSGNGQWQIVGLVAWGIGCATSGVPGVYINVLNFLSWIDEQRS
ncbi:hypothetical protein KM043_013899 [Ampulex compressa]|nr:hypothetical protein KM043_013899 [Ampulex compressa]